MTELILHHYDFSNYSEKVRVAMGFKSLRWKSVVVPPVMPKPDLMPLTGGYRRAPVLQVGADVYCDTRMILRELDRRHPAPTLFPAGCEGLANAVSAWAEGPLFRSIMLYAWGTNHDLMPPQLFEDRARMRGLPVPSVAAAERAAARNAPLVRAQLPLVEDMLADGRTWICGDRFTVADLSVFHALWFLTDRSDRLAHELQRLSAVRSWMERVEQLGHGEREEIAPDEALEIARKVAPAPPSRNGVRHPEDPEYGSLVEVRAVDYAKHAIVGRVEFLDVDEVAIGIRNDRVGDIVVHFPRVGFELRKTRS
ncbi:glutathione S-transferase family protein [Bradyrhizobium australiense]|uniref:Glutathione S-transferase family protein n=1 Tax=Bradyrhizobium australiense TaxID=2721161 RepID=A0A7Y4GPJ5_9BRAD|nr:glutathione S-transferase family protein [Bradyrhizobium australiense]NOJ39102.1 glutathione S-transferase family protein [Bradyrhizobium australiense]